MRVFRYDDVRDQRAIEGDPLHDRWLAQHARGPALALIRLRPELARSEQVMATWLAQAERNAACQAPGILPLLDFGMHAGMAFAAREHVADALPLARLLALLQARGETVSAMLAVHIVRSLCETLSVAHDLTNDGRASPLVHGDLCAERVLVRSDGRLQLTELGFYAAVSADRAVCLRTQGALPEHIPPDAVKGAPIDVAADTFGLGVLLRRMLIPGATEAVSAATRKFVPVLPSHEMVVLIGRLIAPLAGERPRSVADVRQELAMMPSHGAGMAVLAQLHEDVRAGGDRAAQHRASAEASSSAKKTAMFIAPTLPSQTDALGLTPVGGTREAPGGFRGRTQVFGTALMPRAQPGSATPSSIAQVQSAATALVQPAAAVRSDRSVQPAALAPAPLQPAEPPVLSAVGSETHGRFGTMRLTQSEQPPLLSSPAAFPAPSMGDDQPPLLGSFAAERGDARATTSRPDMTGMPPLLQTAPTERPPAPANDLAPWRHSLQGGPSSFSAALRAIEPPLAPRTTESVPPGQQSGDYPVSSRSARPSIRPGSVDEPFAPPPYQSGLRPSQSAQFATPAVPELAMPDGGRTLTRDPIIAPELRKREGWRDPSATLFKEKAPAIMAKLTAHDRMSPVAMFVISMLVATTLIVGIKLLVGFLSS